MTNSLRQGAEVGLTCDLSQAHTFFPYRNQPPVPVVEAFGSGSLHQCRLEGTWDLERAVDENRAALLRSFRQLTPRHGRNGWEDLIFQFGERGFLCADQARIVGYGGTAEDAEKLVADFARAYRIVPPQTGGRFQLIRKEQSDFRCENVTLEADTILSDAEFALRYPSGAAEWHREFVGQPETAPRPQIGFART